MQPALTGVTFGVVVRKAFASSLLSLLLLTTLVWGGCISCEQFFMWPGSKTCCARDGRCKTNRAPAKQNSDRECKQIDYDHHKSIDHNVELPIVAVVKVDPLISVSEGVERWHDAVAVEPSAPDLQVLYSIFLI
jgi:hypothetical protein